jgi:hypothetical protein
MEVDFMSSENNKTAFDADKAEAFSEKLLTPSMIRSNRSTFSKAFSVH